MDCIRELDPGIELLRRYDLRGIVHGFGRGKSSEQCVQQPLRRQRIETHAGIADSEPAISRARDQHGAVGNNKAASGRGELAFGEDCRDLSGPSSGFVKPPPLMRNAGRR